MTFRVDYNAAIRELSSNLCRCHKHHSTDRRIGRQTDIARLSGIRDQDVQSLRKAFPAIRVYDDTFIDAEDVLKAFRVRAAQSQLTAEAK